MKKSLLIITAVMAQMMWAIPSASAADVFIANCFQFNVFRVAGSQMTYYTTTNTDPTHRSNVRVTGAMNIQLTNDHEVAIVMGSTGANILSFKTNGMGYICGGEGNDNLAVNTGITNPHKIKGMGGNDTITGGNGDDFLNGNAGNDQVSGSGGNDIIHGGKNSDYLFGGPGDDILYPALDLDFTINGGAGYDICYTELGETSTQCEG